MTSDEIIFLGHFTKKQERNHEGGTTDKTTLGEFMNQELRLASSVDNYVLLCIKCNPYFFTTYGVNI